MSRMQLDTAAAHECYTELLRREMSTAVGWDALYAPSALMRAPRVEELISHKKYENRLSAYLKAVPLTDSAAEHLMVRSSRLLTAVALAVRWAPSLAIARLRLDPTPGCARRCPGRTRQDRPSASGAAART